MPRIAHRKLEGDEYRAFRDALIDAYARLGPFDDLLLFRLNKYRVDYTGANDRPTVFRDVLIAADDEDWTADLLLAARAERPQNEKLLAFAQRFGLAPTVNLIHAEPGTTETERLEKTIRRANPMLDVAGLLRRLGELEGRVCRVEVPAGLGILYGTGFLVGPDLVLTNYHVLESVITGTAAPADVLLRFDYKRQEGGAPGRGTVYRLAAGDAWRVDSSPYSPLDLLNDQAIAARLPEAGHLDYALVRLEKAAGEQPVGEKGTPDAPLRGWLSLPAARYAFPVGTPLFILQHPQGDTLRLALDTDAVIGLNGNQTRVRYKTNTEPGSSGSPCFDANWEPVALHHVGDPNFNPGYNQGIPLAAIRDLLAERNRLPSAEA